MPSPYGHAMLATHAGKVPNEKSDYECTPSKSCTISPVGRTDPGDCKILIEEHIVVWEPFIAVLSKTHESTKAAHKIYRNCEEETQSAAPRRIQFAETRESCHVSISGTPTVKTGPDKRDISGQDTHLENK